MIDEAAYRRDVLDPAHANGSTRPADLFVRYGLDPRRPLDEPQFQQHVTDVERYWRRIGRQKRYGRLAESLLAGHRELVDAGELSWAAFVRHQETRLATARRSLDRRLENLAASGPCVSAATVARLVAHTDGACTADYVAGRLALAGLRVVDPLWALPSAPPGHALLRGHLRLLGVRFSLDLVLGAREREFRFRPGFQVDGSGPISELIRTALEHNRRRARDERTPVVDGVLTLLERASRTPGALDELLLWELAEVLRPLAEFMPTKEVADEATSLGLVRNEAEELALALREHRAEPVARPQAEVEAALAGGDPRAARRLLDQLPEVEDELRERVEAALARVDEALTRAGRLVDEGRSEEAAEVLSAARRLAPADESLAGRLAAIAPPPAVGVVAGIEAGRAAVSWTSGAARVGPVTYRVVRTLTGPASSASAGTVVAEVTGVNEAVDGTPPLAADLYYTVFARREDGVWSAPSAASEVRFAPEVANVIAVADERSIRVSWLAHRDAVDIRVVRLGDGRTIPAGMNGFTDHEARPGDTHRYRIQAVYTPPSGGRRLTPGVEVAATSRERPAPVSRLSAVRQGPDSVMLSWERPRTGRVVIRAGRNAPPWREGEALRLGDADRYGRELPESPQVTDDGRVTLTAAVEAGPVHFVAVTLGDGEAVAGPVAVVRAADPELGLTARRVGDQVRLNWDWPQDAVAVEVTWSPYSGTGFVLELTRRAFLADGCALSVGPGRGWAAVRVIREDRATYDSAQSAVQVPEAPPRVDFEFRRRVFRPGVALLRLSAERPVQVPELIVVHGTGPTLPLRPSQGRIVHRVPPQLLNPGWPSESEIMVPKSHPSWLVCFPAHPGDGVALVRRPGNW
uniref:hypothetical protein n=1 Tax=Herbidospora sakaeratensis TaxID=564415 RepID=UPI000781697D|nr:hypothetical protein [Herbidospora sakaeratensis]